MQFRNPFFLIAGFLALCAGACSWGRDEGTVEVALIGTSDEMFQRGVRLDPAGQQLRAATVEGLVSFDAVGEVTPALADRWSVTDDGKSYIFRIRDGTWPDGSELSGESVRNALHKTLRSLRGTSLGLDLARISEVRAMAGSVIEIRLSSPLPDLLQLLAQPELGLFHKGRGSGLLKLEREGDVAVLTPVPPEQRGQPAIEDWKDDVRQLRLRAMPARESVAAFHNNEVEVVLGGRIEFLPLADTSLLSRGTVRLDRVYGLFGLRVRSDQGFLDDPSRREAIAMAIDRDELIEPFNIGGWQSATRVVPTEIPLGLVETGERWQGMSMDQRRNEAARRVRAWQSASGKEAVQLSVFLPEGPGSDLLFAGLGRDLAAINIKLERAGRKNDADLVMVDKVARYAGASWFLNQFNCSLREGLCSEQADARVKESLSAADAAESAALLAEAEAEMNASNIYIPIGAPLRWSLVRSDVKGFEANIWGIHSLSALALDPK